MPTSPITTGCTTAGSWDRLVADLLGAGWSLRPGKDWSIALPDGTALRTQGWKLHVSATPSSAATVLTKVAEVLAGRRCAFEFAPTRSVVRALDARNAGPGSAGKFVTVYPAADIDLPELADALDAATRGLAGPAILADRAVRDGSLVHYRYGAFVPMLRLADSGVYETVLYDPDGKALPDRRDVWFEAPSWAPDPLQPELAQPRQLDRFLVRGTTTGDVFRAVDQESGAEVIVKQGRAFVDELPGGGDVRDLLRHEAAMLTKLADTGVVPAVVALLDTPEHTFLVTSAVDGTPLRAHVRELRRESTDLREEVLALAQRLADLVGVVHAAGVVLRDLNPATVLVQPDGQLRLVDLELAAVAGADAIGAGTPGFAAPEQWASAAVPSPAHPSADLFSLGALLFSLVIGAGPVLAKEYPARGVPSRLRPWLDGAAADDPLVARLRPLIMDLMADDPAHRPPIGRVAARLRKPARRVPRPEAPDRGALAAFADRMLDDGIAYLLTTMTGRGADRLWQADAFGNRTDPTTVYYGSSGILAVLVRALAHGPAPRDEVAEAARRAAWWTADRCAEESTVLPGLYFGRPGVVWALLDSAIALGDNRLRDRALELAAGIPRTGPIPGVCHGTAGTGLAFLHCWRMTGEDAFLRDAVHCAEHLLATMDDGAPVWRLPANGQPPLVRHGFAHGTAGIAAFLLDCADATGDPRYLRTATLAADRLCASAVHTASGARWTRGPGECLPASTSCDGGAGIGSFLARSFASTGDPTHLTAAGQAATAARADQWALPPSVCHGVAGNADFLLDLAEVTGAAQHRDAAWQGVAALHARTTHRHGRTVVCDDSGTTAIPGHHTGVAGVLATLMRLRYGGPRPWMPPLPGHAARPRALSTSWRLRQS